MDAGCENQGRTSPQQPVVPDGWACVAEREGTPCEAASLIEACRAWRQAPFVGVGGGGRERGAGPKVAKERRPHMATPNLPPTMLGAVRPRAKLFCYTSFRARCAAPAPMTGHTAVCGGGGGGGAGARSANFACAKTKLKNYVTPSRHSKVEIWSRQVIQRDALERDSAVLMQGKEGSLSKGSKSGSKNGMK